MEQLTELEELSESEYSCDSEKLGEKVDLEKLRKIRELRELE